MLLTYVQLLEKLHRGITVIADRYAASGVAYSAGKGLDFEWCCAPDAGLPAPDLVICLDATVDVTASRGNYGAEVYDNKATQYSVLQVYERLAALDKDGRWRRVDASPAPEAVLKDLVPLVEAEIETQAGELAKPIGTLLLRVRFHRL